MNRRTSAALREEIDASPVQQPHKKVVADVVKLPYWGFALWWLIILGVHVVTSAYNALYAYCYWKLKDASLLVYLEFYHIGLSQEHHNTIAVVHAVMSAVHGVCILLMLGGSLWQLSLAFSPWSNSSIATINDTTKPNSRNSDTRKSSIITSGVVKIWGPHGFCGVNGAHFHEILVWREVIETTFQTIQAYRMSVLLPRTVLNRFYVFLLAVNCWSSIIVHSVLRKRGEAQKRLACIVCDCVLDLVACMGIVLIILLSYASEDNRETLSFDYKFWWDDEWLARALNDFQMVVVVSWSDLASRSIFSLTLVVATADMKELLRYLPGSTKKVAQSTGTSASDADAASPQPFFKRKDSDRETIVRTSGRRGILRLAHLLFGVWGLMVLGFHVHASLRASLPQCLMQARPWAVSRPSCYLAGLDCHVLGISGEMQQVHEKWSEFHASSVVQLLIRHCPALEVPDVISEFNNLRGMKIYNTTISNWGESAAITNTNHPDLTYMSIVRVNFSTDGLLPAGFQSSDFPQKMNDIELCVTNLLELPDDLDTKWPLGAIIQVEYSQLSELPLVLARLQPYYTFLTGNPITELPAEIFEVEGMVYLGVSGTNIRELPHNVTRVYPDLIYIELVNTDISFFWSWVDDLVGRVDRPASIAAGGSIYCNELEKIENGTVDGASSSSLAPDYSTILMDRSHANLPAIAAIVDCDFGEEPFYSLAFDDNANALQPPPPLPRHG